MPNLVKVTLTLHGPREALDAFREAFVTPDDDGDYRLDYRRVVPVSAPFSVQCPERRAAWGSHHNGRRGSWTDFGTQLASLEFLAAWQPPEPVLKALTHLPEMADINCEITARDEWLPNGTWIGRIGKGHYSLSKVPHEGVKPKHSPDHIPVA